MTGTDNDQQASTAALRPLALLATGATGADIERLVREARAKARRERRPLVWNDIERVITSASRPPHETLDWQVAVHELGHAIAYTALDIGVVETIRIGGRGGEVATQLDVSTMQDEEGVMKLIAATLAGRTAEKLVLGKVMIGAGGDDDSDLAKATRFAVQAETAFGLAEEMPLLYRSPANPSDALLYHPQLADRVHRRLEAAEAIAQDILVRHLDVLATLASRLQRCRVIEGHEVVDALARRGPDRR